MIPGKKYNSTIQFSHGEKSFLEDSALKSGHFKDDEDLKRHPTRPSPRIRSLKKYRDLDSRISTKIIDIGLTVKLVTRC